MIKFSETPKHFQSAVRLANDDVNEMMQIISQFFPRELGSSNPFYPIGHSFSSTLSNIDEEYDPEKAPIHPWVRQVNSSYGPDTLKYSAWWYIPLFRHDPNPSKNPFWNPISELYNGSMSFGMGWSIEGSYMKSEPEKQYLKDHFFSCYCCMWPDYHSGNSRSSMHRPMYSNGGRLEPQYHKTEIVDIINHLVKLKQYMSIRQQVCSIIERKMKEEQNAKHE